MGFGADEGVAPEVESQVSPDVSGEVVAADVVGAGEIACVNRLIEPQILAANPSHNIGAEFLLKVPAVYGVEIIENGPVFLNNSKIVDHAAICGLTPTRGHFAAEAEVVPEQNVSTEGGVEASAQ